MRAQSSALLRIRKQETMGAFRGSRQRPPQPARMVSLKGRGRKSKWTRDKYGLLWYALVPMLNAWTGYPGLSAYGRIGEREARPPLKAFRHPRHGSNGAGRDQWINNMHRETRWHVGENLSIPCNGVSLEAARHTPHTIVPLPFRQGESLCIFTNLFRWKFDHS